MAPPERENTPSTDTIPSDVVRVRDLLLIVPISNGAQWPPKNPSLPTKQPIRLSLTVPYDLRVAAQNDDISASLNYGSLSSTVLKSLEGPHLSSGFASLEALLDHVFSTCFVSFPDIQQMKVDMTKTRASPYAEAFLVQSTRKRNGTRIGRDIWGVKSLQCNLIVGLNACEREDKQAVHFDVEVSRSHEDSDVDSFDFRSLGKRLRETVEQSSFISLESLASLAALTTLRHTARHSDIVTVRAAKPKALVFAEAAEVEIVRTLQDYDGPLTTRPPAASHSDPPMSPLGLAKLMPPSMASEDLHTAGIALGSNLGDSFALIELALRMLEDPDRRRLAGLPPTAKVDIVNTSFLYETAPMYVTDQPKFINGACMIETDLKPVQLLKLVKHVEDAVGRVKTIRNGPRAVDLDILTYDDLILDTRPENERADLENLEGQLVVPHPRMYEREFALRPLSDMIPDYVHPVLKKTIAHMLDEVLATNPPDAWPMNKVMPFPRYLVSAPSSEAKSSSYSVPPTLTSWSFPATSIPGVSDPHKNTRVMATLNATPDSFSDGSTHNTIATGLEYAFASFKAGAQIIDIGGYSTRPGADYVSSEEEIDRVVPMIQAIRSHQTAAGVGEPSKPQLKDILISVDTFRPDVARAAIVAGANCINDVYAFTGPSYPLTSDSASHLIEMRALARELYVPVILMHSRGDAGQNKDYSSYSYTGKSAVLEGVVLELGEKVEAIVRGKGGVRRWMVMVDPGVGFSKSVKGNLDVLRDAAKISAPTLPSSSHRNPLKGYPMLIGTSRKSFLGKILEENDSEKGGNYGGRETIAAERGWATAAAVTCAVQQGAVVVRVHDALEMGDVTRVANALWS